jgi:hypothetical protein
MYKSKNEELVSFDPEIERSLRQLRELNKTKIEMEEEFPQQQQPIAIKEFIHPVINNLKTAVVRPSINVNNFEFKLSLINMVRQNQFSGGPLEDLHTHLSIFLEICDTVRSNGVSDDAMKLRLFTFSFTDRARSRLQSLPPNTITTWNDIANKILAQFFSP